MRAYGNKLQGNRYAGRNCGLHIVSMDSRPNMEFVSAALINQIPKQSQAKNVTFCIRDEKIQVNPKFWSWSEMLV